MRIRTRLTLLFTLISSSTLLVITFFVIYFFALFREQEFYNLLYDKAFTAAELLLDVEEIDVELLKTIDKHNLTPLNSEEVMMFDKNLHMIFDSGDENIEIKNDYLKRVLSKKVVYQKKLDRESIGVLINHGGNEFIVVVSAIDIDGFGKIRNLVFILGAGWIVYTLLMLAAGRYFSYKALDPISRVILEVDTITASNLNKRVNEGNGKDEIATLAATFNNMLKRLENSFTIQRNFVSNASHELRTPLTSIRGHVEVTLLQERSPEEYRQTLRSILEDMRKLTDMTNSLLNLATVSADVGMMAMEKIRIDDVIFQTRDDLLRKHPDYKVEVEFDERFDDENLLIVNGNEQFLKIAFINLMENGCKYSAKHTVRVMILTPQKSLKILFIDTGIGIPTEDVPHIFEPFYRSSSTRNLPGYGIGLSLTHRIIRLHNGTIEVNSTKGVGSIFTITLNGPSPGSQNA